MDDLSQILSKQATKTPDRKAVLTADNAYSYAEVENLVSRCANLLASHGVTRHQICGLTFSDPLCLLIAWLALARLHVGIVNLPHHLPKIERERLISACSVGAIVSDQPAATNNITNVHVTFALIENTQLRKLQDIKPGKGEIEYVVAGSGSTGKPKLIAFDFGTTKARAEQLARTYAFRDDDILFSHISLQFCTPICICMGAFTVGAAAVVANLNNAEIITIPERLGVTVLESTVCQAEALITWARGLGRRLDNVRAFLIGSSVVSDGLVERLKSALAENIIIDYGSNECWPVTTLDTTRESRPQGSVGRATRGSAVEIVDRQDQVVPVNHSGEVRMRSAGMMSRYIGQPEATQSALRDGWFYPGDIGKLDEDGHLILLGRSDHMMIYNGINIYPAEIEHAMDEHPAVKDVAVMPSKHPIHQDIPVCAVVLHSDQSITEKELQAFGEQRLGARSAKAVFIVESIPRNELGKLIRTEMAQLFSNRIKHRSKA